MLAGIEFKWQIAEPSQMCKIPYIAGPIFSADCEGHDSMPKWVAYCPECDHCSPFRKIDISTLDLATPKLKKPVLPAGGESWLCPICKRQTRVRDCDLTYSHAA